MPTQGPTTTETPTFEADRIHCESNLNAWKDSWRVLRAIAREALRPTTPAPPNTFINVIPVPLDPMSLPVALEAVSTDFVVAV
ncbi:MAG: hypothetical protein ACJAXA_003144 [Candidatus Aldehydirespiratoraceae bacterium]|jgi:hypothetical protein